jgi:hypothetical protein
LGGDEEEMAQFRKKPVVIEAGLYPCKPDIFEATYEAVE